MSHPNGADYYHRRLLQAQALAARATLPEVKAIHQEFARRYAELIRAEPIRAGPVQIEPSRAELIRADPIRIAKRAERRETMAPPRPRE